MRAAAEARDADAFNRYVDYGKLRESLKGQFSALMVRSVSKSTSGNNAESAGAALGMALGLAFADKMIEALVRPEMVMSAMNEARLKQPGMGTDNTKAKRNVRWTIERKGVDRVIAYGNDAANESAPQSERVGFVFDREGFARWKLTEIRLPDAVGAPK